MWATVATHRPLRLVRGLGRCPRASPRSRWLVLALELGAETTPGVLRSVLPGVPERRG